MMHTTMLSSAAAGQLQQLASLVLARIKAARIAPNLCTERQERLGLGRRTMVLKGELCGSCVPAI